RICRQKFGRIFETKSPGCYLCPRKKWKTSKNRGKLFIAQGSDGE
ncbi:hypothetical protein QZH41_008185, partial [Actinostola sp. cb2023]